MVVTDLERKVELMAVEGWKGQPVRGGGGGEKMKEQRGRTSHINSCGSPSANLEHR